MRCWRPEGESLGADAGRISRERGTAHPLGERSVARGKVQNVLGNVSSKKGDCAPRRTNVSDGWGAFQTVGEAFRTAGRTLQTLGGTFRTARGMFQTAGRMSQTAGGMSQTAGGMSRTAGECFGLQGERSNCLGEHSPFWGRHSPSWERHFPFGGDVPLERRGGGPSRTAAGDGQFIVWVSAG